MFIDTTPGTPKRYREEVLTKLYRVGIDIENNIIQGTDCVTNYNMDYSRSIREMDELILNKLGLTQEQMEKYCYKNLLRFLGKS